MEDEMRKQHETSRITEEMIYNTAHELRAPLTTIKGYVQLAVRCLENGEAREDVVDFLRLAETQVDNTTAFINQMLDVARIDAGQLSLEKECFDLGALIDDVIPRINVTTQRHHLRFISPERPVEVWADPVRIRQVVVNLLTNAIKYSPTGGDVDLRVTKTGSFAVVAVTDQGMGIPAAEQPRVFEKMYRVKSAPMKGLLGTGLGLYICRAIVEAHGGEIRIKSKVGEGATFSFTIPTIPAR